MSQFIMPIYNLLSTSFDWTINDLRMLVQWHTLSAHTRILRSDLQELRYKFFHQKWKIDSLWFICRWITSIPVSLVVSFFHYYLTRFWNSMPTNFLKGLKSFLTWFICESYCTSSSALCTNPIFSDGNFYQ